MAIRGKHRKLNRKRSLVVAGAATAMVGGLLAPAAHAWDNDPHVIVKGGGGCRQLFYQATFVHFALNNGETANSLFTNGSYRVEFFNIPGGPIPTGATGTAAVLCTNVLTNASYVWTRGVSIQRPRIGNIQTLNLGGG